MKLGRRIILALVALFLVFYVVTRPEAAADAVQTVWNWILGAVLAVSHFFTALAT